MSTTSDGSTKRKAPLLTTVWKTFLDKLEPGDLLLFDSMHFVSNLIKLADNRPINHCAVYIGDDFVVHCADNDADPDHCVFRMRLDKLMDPLRVRTVTALRHANVTTKIAQSVVVDRAMKFVTEAADYAFVDLALLAGPCLLRAYRGELAEKDLFTISSMLQWAASLSQRLSRIVDLAKDPKPGDPVALTCSSFAYRCYVDGSNLAGDESFPVVLHKPIITNNNAGLVPPGPGPSLGPLGPFGITGPSRFDIRVGSFGNPGYTFIIPDVESQLIDIELEEFDMSGLTFHSALEDPSPRESARFDLDTDGMATQTSDYAFSGAQGTGLDASIRLIDLCRRGRNIAFNLYRHSRPYGQSVPIGPVDADVTPRDLWGSDSFHAKVVFHRPPSGWEDDDRLIDVPEF